MLRYSGAARETLPAFYRFYNEVDVYIEDEDDEVFYEELLSEVAGDLVRITRVFGVGGKQRLLQMAREPRDAVLTKELLITDGDFDRILNRSFPETDRLYVLDEYCIENFLFEESAVCCVVQEERPTRALEQWRQRLSFARWLEEVVDGLTPLFACFILIQRYDLSTPNVGLGVGKFISDGGSPSLDKSKIEAYIASIRAQSSQWGSVEFDKELSGIVHAMGDNWQRRKQSISGKDYLLPLLLFEIVKHTQRKVRLDSLRFRLMKHCAFDSLASLRSRIEQAFCLPMKLKGDNAD